MKARARAVLIRLFRPVGIGLEPRMSEFEASLLRRMDRLENHVSTDTEIASELAVTQSRTLDRIEEHLSAIAERDLDAAAAQLAMRPLAQLGPGAAALVEAAASGRFAAGSGLDFAPAVRLGYTSGAVEVRAVSSRVIETPWAIARLADLVPAADILVVDGADDPLAYSLAALGHRVCLVDPRGYALEHPSLSVRETDVELLDPAPASFDAVVALSASEGLGPRRPAALLEAVREAVRPEGRAVVTAAGDAGDAGPGWRTLQLSRFVTPDGVRWASTDDGAPPQTRTISCLHAARER